MNKKNKIIIMLLLAVSAVGIFLYLKKPGEDVSGPTVVAEKKASSFAEGREILAVLNKLKGVELKNNVFSDEVFRSLVDGTVSPASETPGRINPFAPVNSEEEKTITTQPARSTNNQNTSSGSVRAGTSPFTPTR